MPLISTKLASIATLTLHERIPITNFGFRPPTRAGSDIIIPGYVVIDRASNKVVAGLVPFQSAQAASHGGKTAVKLVCRYIDGIPETFATTWPTIEAAASQLTKKECEKLLVELLKRDAACVKKDKGRRVAKDFEISDRQLKRLRALAREERHIEPGVLTKKRKTKKKKKLSDESCAPMDGMDASNAPKDPAPVEAGASVAAAQMSTTDNTTGTPCPIETATAALLDRASPMAFNATATSSNQPAESPAVDTLPSDGTKAPTARADGVRVEASASSQAPVTSIAEVAHGMHSAELRACGAADDRTSEDRAPPLRPAEAAPAGRPASFITAVADPEVCGESVSHMTGGAAARTNDLAFDALQTDFGMEAAIEALRATRAGMDERADDETAAGPFPAAAASSVVVASTLDATTPEAGRSDYPSNVEASRASAMDTPRPET